MRPRMPARRPSRASGRSLRCWPAAHCPPLRLPSSGLRQGPAEGCGSGCVWWVLRALGKSRGHRLKPHSSRCCSSRNAGSCTPGRKASGRRTSPRIDTRTSSPVRLGLGSHGDQVLTHQVQGPSGTGVLGGGGRGHSPPLVRCPLLPLRPLPLLTTGQWGSLFPGDLSHIFPSQLIPLVSSFVMWMTECLEPTTSTPTTLGWVLGLAAPVAYMNQTLVTPFPIIMSLELLEWSVDFGKTTDTRGGCSSLHWVLRGANPETAGLNIGPKPLPPSMDCV